jgi:hypothetical protein
MSKTPASTMKPIAEDGNESVADNCGNSSSSNLSSPLSISSSSTALYECPNSTPKSSRSTGFRMKQPQINNVISNIRSYEG